MSIVRPGGAKEKAESGAGQPILVNTDQLHQAFSQVYTLQQPSVYIYNTPVQIKKYTYLRLFEIYFGLS